MVNWIRLPRQTTIDSSTVAIDGKRGLLTVSRELYQEHFDSAQWIAMFLSEDKSLIGLKPLKEKDRDAYRIRSPKGGRAFKVNCMNLVKTMDLEKSTVYYKAVWEDDILVLHKKEVP